MVFGYVVTQDGIKMDPSKIEVILSWPIPNSMHNVRSFHGLASFFRRFIRGFNFIMALITKCLKGDRFKRASDAQDSFELIKSKVTKVIRVNYTHILLPYT